MRVRALLLGTVVAALLAFPVGASACSCVGPEVGQSRSDFVKERIRESDGAIVGRLISVTQPVYGPGVAWFRYRILYVAKGGPRLQRGEVVAVKSGGSGNSCGLPQQKGRRYGLTLSRVSHGAARRWSAYLCDLFGPREIRAQGSREAGRSDGSAGCS